MLDKIEVPICIGTNWGNPGLHMKGAFQAWAGIHAPKRLFIGPPDPRWPWANYQDELLAWYDYHLKGIDSGIEEQPPVRYWLQGANLWRSASDWPIPGAIKQRCYLSVHSDESLKQQNLQAEPPTQETSLSFVAIPRHMLYPKVLDHYEAQMLRYATEPFRTMRHPIRHATQSFMAAAIHHTSNGRCAKTERHLAVLSGCVAKNRQERDGHAASVYQFASPARPASNHPLRRPFLTKQ